MALIIREINNSDDLIRIFKLRIEVFTFEQNCPIEEEFDFYDNLNSGSTQFIVEKNSECIGTARITYYSNCLLYTSPSPRDDPLSRMPSSA